MVHESMFFAASDGSAPRDCEGDYSHWLHCALAHDFTEDGKSVSFKMVHRYLG
jgi:hypothetical protein